MTATGDTDAMKRSADDKQPSHSPAEAPRGSVWKVQGRVVPPVITVQFI